MVRRIHEIADELVGLAENLAKRVSPLILCRGDEQLYFGGIVRVTWGSRPIIWGHDRGPDGSGRYAGCRLYEQNEFEPGEPFGRPATIRILVIIGRVGSLRMLRVKYRRCNCVFGDEGQVHSISKEPTWAEGCGITPNISSISRVAGVTGIPCISRHGSLLAIIV